MSSLKSQVDALAVQLGEILGEDCVIRDSIELDVLSSDVYSTGIPALLAIRPENRANMPAAVSAITDAGFAVVPRGGGMSYTGGYTPIRPDTVIIDTGRMNQIVDVDVDNMVITVEAGVTWKQIYETLNPLGLRLPFFGTFSGVHATVGGGMSNGALFMGTGRYGTAAEIVLGMEIVSATGRLIRTGQAAFKNGKPFYRTYGPDLTGLFVHDAGSLGVKTLISMRMMKRLAMTGYASFVFEDTKSVVGALSEIARQSIAEEAYIFDPETTRRSLDAADLRQDLRRLLGVVRAGETIIRGLRAGAALVGAGRDFVDRDLFSLHVVCSGNGEASVREDIERCCAIVDAAGGGEIASSIPRAARANPFEPLNGILGNDGDRWAALNAKVAHTDAAALVEATDAIFEKYAAEMSKHRVSYSRLFIAISNHSFSFEPVMRWYDEWLPLHKRIPEPQHLAKFEEPAPNLDGRELVAQIRQEIVELFVEKGAASNQIGKTYPYFSSLNEETAQLVLDLKKSLDPDGLMNPGALGFPNQD